MNHVSKKSNMWLWKNGSTGEIATDLKPTSGMIRRHRFTESIEPQPVASVNPKNFGPLSMDGRRGEKKR